MSALITLLAGLIPFAYNESFSEHFYIPKLALFFLLGMACVVLLFRHKQVRLPGKMPAGLLMAWVALGLVAALRSLALSTSLPHVAYVACAVFIFLVVFNATNHQVNSLLICLLAVSAIQGLLATAQYFRLAFLPPPLFPGDPDEIIGTIGNREFLATFLAFNILAGLDVCSQATSKQKRYWIAALLACCLLGLLTTKSKGTLLLLPILLLTRSSRCRPAGIAAAIGGIVVLLFQFPDSIKGRLLLWLSSALVAAQHPMLGVGPGMIGSHYLDAVITLFFRFPMLRDSLGSHTAIIRDAHNLPLQFGAEMGLVGFFLASIGLGALARAALSRSSFLSSAVLLLVIKTLYTVVLSSVTGMLLAAIGAAGLLRGRVPENRLNVRRPVFLFAASCFLAGIIFSSYFCASDFFYQRGMMALRRVDPIKASEALAMAVRMNPENSDVLLALAFDRFTARDAALMDFYIREAIRNRKNMDTLKISAHMYYHRGRLEQAKSLYAIVLMAFPEHLTSMVRLAQIAYEQGDLRSSRKLAEQVLRTKPRTESASDGPNRLIATELIKRTPPIL